MADTTTTATISAARIAQIPAEYKALMEIITARFDTITTDEFKTLAGIVNGLQDEYLRLTGDRL